MAHKMTRTRKRGLPRTNSAIAPKSIPSVPSPEPPQPSPGTVNVSVHTARQSLASFRDEPPPCTVGASREELERMLTAAYRAAFGVKTLDFAGELVCDALRVSCSPCTAPGPD